MGSRANRTALVTGGSGGIGLAVARELAGRGLDLVLVARDEQRLASAAKEIVNRFGVDARTIVMDLCESGAAERLVNQLDGPIDLLVNNAGIGIQGEFASADEQRIAELLQLNIVALTQLSRLLLPPMIERRWGRILNIASLAGFLPGPLTAIYNASKAYVISLSEALSIELRKTGVTVTVLCPGPTRTDFANRAGLTGSTAFSGNEMDPAQVAREGVNALLRGRLWALPGWANKLRMLPIRLVPRRILGLFSERYHRTDAEQSRSPVLTR